MKWKVALLLTTGMVLSLLGEGPAAQLAQMTTSEILDFARGGTIRSIDSYGDLYIEGWDRAQVEITIIKSTDFYEPAAKEKAKKRLETVTVVAERRSDTELAIMTTLPKLRSLTRPLPTETQNKVTMEYRIRVPRDVRLAIRHRGGSVLAGNVTGDVEAANRDGDIIIMLPAEGTYSIDARSKMGHIASDFEGRTLSRYLIGQRFVATNSSARRIHLRVGFGGITILAIPPEAEALRNSGSETSPNAKMQ